ncbi:MAG: TSUP family transporter [Candidatus Kapabacteria bacterium]|nr:TSUP family transporter [Candidatus Kapabacteria bacterium]
MSISFGGTDIPVCEFPNTASNLTDKNVCATMKKCCIPWYNAVTMSSFHHIVGASVNPFGDLILSSEVAETSFHDELTEKKHSPNESVECAKPTVLAANTLFPMFVKLEQFRLLIVGGGAVGLEKLSAVLANSPQTPITVVAREILPNLRALAADKANVQLVERVFRESDLDNHDFVIAATDDKALHHDIRRLARERRLLVNVADTPDLCDFYLSSIVQKGDLKIAISTNGKSPTLGKRLKEILNDVIPSDIHQTLQNLAVIRGRLDGSFAEKVQRMNEVTAALVEESPSLWLPPLSSGSKSLSVEAGSLRLRWTPLTIGISGVFVLTLMFLGHLLFQLVPTEAVSEYASGLAVQIDVQVLTYIGIGFLAQMIDGAFGMAYGPTTTSFLMAMGISPAIASATLHTAEVFAAGTASVSYYRHKNINFTLFKLLVLAGIIGAILGASLLSFVSKEQLNIVKPLVALYTLSLGVIVIRRALVSRTIRPKKNIRLIPAVGFVGSFFDSIGGGGWGAIVTSSLVALGRDVRYAIGSAHLAKFVVATTSTITFVLLLGFHHWLIVAGVVAGSMLAAPFSVMIGNRIPKRKGLIIVGVLVIVLSLRTILRSFGIPVW